jgi:hypothetical protein
LFTRQDRDGWTNEKERLNLDQYFGEFWSMLPWKTIDVILARRHDRNLGVLYSDQGKLKEVEEMYQRVLKGYEKAWGAGGLFLSVSNYQFK